MGHVQKISGNRGNRGYTSEYEGGWLRRRVGHLDDEHMSRVGAGGGSSDGHDAVRVDLGKLMAG